MCIAIPGKIISLEDRQAVVEFKGNRVKVNVALVRPKEGDYVLVHAGCAIQIIQPSEAEEMLEILGEM
jgi:hydrogenase expression/formation protein HypC